MSAPTRSERSLKTGHAPGHIRECLIEALDDFERDWWKNLNIELLRERHQRWWNESSNDQRAYWLLGQLWHCTDIVSGGTMDWTLGWLRADDDSLYEKQPLRTYAALARLLKNNLDLQIEAPQAGIAEGSFTRS